MMTDPALWKGALWVSASAPLGAFSATCSANYHSPDRRAVSIGVTCDGTFELYGARRIDLGFDQGRYLQGYGTATVFKDKAGIGVSLSDSEWSLLLSTWQSSSEKILTLRAFLASTEVIDTNDIVPPLLRIQAYHLFLGCEPLLITQATGEREQF
jgi:hypothetical protein